MVVWVVVCSPLLKHLPEQGLHCALAQARCCCYCPTHSMVSASPARRLRVGTLLSSKTVTGDTSHVDVETFNYKGQWGF